jgi:hypothetical protein
VLNSTPIAIGLYDAASGQTIILAGITNCTGVLVSSNKVLYQDAFNANGARASVVCTAERGSFAADVVLTSRIDPADYGFPAKTTRIQMITEYYDAPEPDRIRTAIRIETDAAVRQQMVTPDLMDETLGFGELAFGQGLAYTMTNGTGGATLAAGGASVPASRGDAIVAKEFLSTDGRAFLVESVEYPSIQNALQSLPQTKPKGAFLTPKRSKKAEYAKIPAAGWLAALPARGKTLAPRGEKRSRSEIASITPVGLTGVCIDPTEYIDSVTITTAKVFRGDTTYFLSGPVYCNGPVTIEGGTVIKYPNSTGPGATTAFLQFNNALTCKTAQYRPAVFTANDDDSVGDLLPSSTHNPSGTYYANPAIVSGSALTLNNCRFFYAKVAIRCSGGNVMSVTVQHSQFVNCAQGISIISSGSGSGSGSLAVQLNNCLMAGVNYCLDFGSGAGRTLSAGFTHCTIANATALKGGTVETSPVVITSLNSVFANVGSLSVDSYVTIGGDYNGFYSSSLPSFGSHNPDPPSSSPFQASGGGNYYLNGDNFRGKGSAAINGAVLTALKTRTTEPPIAFPRFMLMSGEMTLFPQTPRYVSGNPDLGYHYDALDYTVAAMAVTGKITVLPGTAIGFRQETETEDWPWSNLARTMVGFDMWAGGAITSHGFPDKPNIFTDAQTVQESSIAPVLCWFPLSYDPIAASAEGVQAPVLDFRFSQFSGLEDYWIYYFWGGWDETGFALVLPWSLNCASYLTLRDCTVYGGKISLGKTVQGSVPAPIPAQLTLGNSVFDRVLINIDPDWLKSNDSTLYVDLGVNAHNNLFRGSQAYIGPINASAGDWVFKDNLFDKEEFHQDASYPLSHDFNAYWLLLDSEVQSGGAKRLAPDGSSDRLLTATPPYLSGPLGDYYLSTGSELYNSLKRGSRAVDDAGLHHYTTRFDQTKDGDQSGNVIIGRHYIATLNSSSTNPKDSDVDGIPDYVEDANGNGSWDPDTETKIDSAYTVAGTHDSLSTIYDDVDLDGDGMVGRIEKDLASALGISPQPLVLNNPFSLTPSAVENPETGTFTVSIPYNVVNSLGMLNFCVDGSPIQLSTVSDSGGNQCLVRFNTTFFSPGEHFLNVTFNHSPSGSLPEVPIISAPGPILAFTISNIMRFDPSLVYFTEDGGPLHAELVSQQATYTIALYDPAAGPLALPFKTIPDNPPGTTASGFIDEFWDGKYPNGDPYLGDSVKATFTVTPQGGTPQTRSAVSGLTPTEGSMADNFTVAYGHTGEQSSDADFWRHTCMQYALVDILLQGVEIAALSGPDYDSTFNRASDGTGAGGYDGLIPNTSDVNTYVDYLISDLQRMTTRNFFFYGHGLPGEISGAFSHKDNGKVTRDPPYFKIGHQRVGTALGNVVVYSSSNVRWPRQHPYRVVIMDACDTLDALFWPTAFGIGPNNNGVVVPFRQCFAGFQGTVYGPFYAEEWIDYGWTYEWISYNWMDGSTLAFTLRRALEYYPDPTDTSVHLTIPLAGGPPTLRVVGNGIMETLPNLKFWGYETIKRVGP